MSEKNSKKQKELSKKKRTIIISAVAGVIVIALCIGIYVWKNAGSYDVTIGAAFDYDEDGYIKLGNYKELNIDVSVSDDDVEAEIESILETEEVYEQKQGQPVNGDMVNIDYKAYVDGQIVDDYSETDDILEIGAEDFYPEFDTAVLGMNTGETKNIDVNFDSDYEDELVAGKTINFELTLNYICGNQIQAELSDDFVTQYSEGECTAVADFYEYIKNSLYQDNVDSIEDTVWEEAIEKVEVKKYHKGEVKTAFEEEKSNYENVGEVIGGTYEDILEQFGMSEDDVEEIAQDVALERMTAKTIAAKENLVLDDETYKNLLFEYMQDEDTDVSSMSLSEVEDSYREIYSGEPREGMFVEYIKKFVVDHANVTGMAS
ncbi:MAG: FKBP-type peptidyl-prolyl cis-trans isomerase [Lachnospiraceae bacterium]|nr:FKBP-type peptidyl-prolyl cis-trans isomerase [Lachnospiraceae bacterium]